MNRRIILGILLVLVGIAVVAAIANNAYHAGVARGLAESGRESAPGALPRRAQRSGQPSGKPLAQ